MIPSSATFRGFNTFKKPTSLDLAALGPGVFAIQGDNGAGKTTLLELLGPGLLYMKFPSRKPSEIHDYIDTRRGAEGSLRFQAGGELYTARVAITAKGKKTAFLTRHEPGGDVPLVTGKVTVFKDVIERMFGPLQANLASVFGQQGGGGGFEAMERADRKKLFRWYLGLDGIDRYHKEVSARIDSIDVAGIERTEELLADAREEHSDLVDKATKLTEEEKTAAKALRLVRKEYEELLESVPLAEQAERLAKIERDAEAYAELAEELEEKLQDAVKLIDTDTADEEERIEVLREIMETAEEAEEACDLAVSSFDELKRQRNDLLEQAELLAEVPCSDYEDCADCKFLLKATVAKTELPHVEKDLKRAKKSAKALQAAARVSMAAGNMAEDELDELRQLVKQMRQTERRQGDAKVQRARDEEQLAASERALTRAVDEMEDLSEGLPFDEDGEVDYDQIPSTGDIREAKKQMEEANEDCVIAGEELTDVKVRVGILEERVSNLETKLEGLRREAGDLKALKLLHRALGPAGFPIFEIDAAGPDVSGIINDLLEACYGARFSVSIQTLTPKKKGKGFKEDFDFIIRDTKASEDRTIGQISGGEKTIVGEAMRIGFALYQAGRAPAPCRFQTMFRDEAEGSLSPDNARRYVRMLARARELGDFNQIFFVTHNEYAAASANGILRVRTGGAIHIMKGAV